MGYIGDPQSIDFVVKSKPLTDEERGKISAFIRDYKNKQVSKPTVKAKV